MTTARGRARSAYCAAVAISWVVLVALMWKALHTMPAAAELANERHVRPPLPGDFVLESAKSFGEMLVVTVLVGPWWRRGYFLRAVAALLILMAWFLFTVPLDLNTMEWLHRRWLAFVIMSVPLLLVATAIPRLFRKERDATTAAR